MEELREKAKMMSDEQLSNWETNIQMSDRMSDSERDILKIIWEEQIRRRNDSDGTI